MVRKENRRFNGFSTYIDGVEPFSGWSGFYRVTAERLELLYGTGEPVLKSGNLFGGAVRAKMQ